MFYFDLPVSEYYCEVSIHIELQYLNFEGHWQYMDSRNNYFETDCIDPGNVSLVMDGAGEVWDDWSNLNNGTNDMTWELTDLNMGTDYALDWYVRVNDDFVLYEHQTWAATSDTESMSWSFSIDNSTTCNVEIRYRMFVDTSGTSAPSWMSMKENSFWWYPNCDQWVYPDDSYASFEFWNGTDWAEEPDSLPAGETDLQVHFENLSVGATYRLYFYHSNTGFPSESDYHYSPTTAARWR